MYSFNYFKGTPLQLLMVNKIKNEGSINRGTKSISDSIKKHIFHKSIMSRTPKRTNNFSPSSSSNFGTPNTSIGSIKSRALFQSPICNSNINISSNASLTINNKHNLHKSISSTSLLTANNSAKIKTKLKINESTLASSSSIISTKTLDTKIISPTISRTINPLSKNDDVHSDNDSEDELLSLSSDHKIHEITEEIEKTIKQADENDGDKKTIVMIKFNEYPELKSKYKSEPNLSRMIYDDEFSNDFSGNMSNSNSNITKGNSMTNLRIIESDEILLSNQQDNLNVDINCASSPSAFDVVSPSSSSVLANICKGNRNFAITSTPSIFLGRRSMSPITKSTQRMPKSMQESIMTPRSRKPVMLTTTLGSSSERNHTACQSDRDDLSELREKDEENSFHIKNSSCTVTSDQQQKQQGSNQNRLDYERECETDNNIINDATNSLTDTFREYLLSRKVLTTSPEDSSFSSHSDDFGSVSDIHNISEDNLNESLLYCLNGYNPIDERNNFPTITTSSSLSPSTTSLGKNEIISSSATDCCDSVINLRRKRSHLIEEKENFCNENNIQNSAKILITEKTYNETSI